ncbi:MAG TPA: biliverdin-producing heme oxygenase [Kofleriaceae bacterium]|nr:biliverdin-producing heme oxygenase [Kofleriaceae bacterium]
MLQDVVTRPATLMARLNAATAPLHDRELFAGRVSWLDYRLTLVRLYGFHTAVEAGLAAFRPLASVVSDAGLRNHKAALLAHDLVALGIERRDLTQVPRMAFTPPRELAEALGWTYVVESPTVRGKLVARRLARHLPEEIQRASAYLGCYGDEAPARWRELGDAFDAFALGRTPAPAARGSAGAAARTTGFDALPDELAYADRSCARVIDAARDGAIQLRRWLGPVLQPRTSQRHA